MTEETNMLKEEVKAMVKEVEEGWVRLKESVERQTVQIDEFAKSQTDLRESFYELKAKIEGLIIHNNNAQMS